MSTPTTSSNGQGTAALVLGILAVALIFIPGVSSILAIVGVILGANGRAAARTGHATNGTAATWGLALSIINLVVWGALILLWQLGQ